MSWYYTTVEKLDEKLFAIVGFEKVFFTLFNDALSINNFKTLKCWQNNYKLSLYNCIFKNVNVLLTEVCYFSSHIYINMLVGVNFVSIYIL